MIVLISQEVGVPSVSNLFLHLSFPCPESERHLPCPSENVLQRVGCGCGACCLLARRRHSPDLRISLMLLLDPDTLCGAEKSTQQLCRQGVGGGSLQGIPILGKVDQMLPFWIRRPLNRILDGSGSWSLALWTTDSSC